MNITVTTPPAPFDRAGILHKVDADHYSLVPLHIKFEVHDLKWIVEGVIFTDETTGQDAVPELLQVTVRRKPGGPPVDPGILRGIKLGEIKTQAIQEASEAWERVGETTIRPVLTPAHKRTAKLAGAKGSRVRSSDLEAAAAAYLAAKAEGRRDLLVAITEACAVSLPTASRWKQEAERRGLLQQEEAK